MKYENPIRKIHMDKTEVIIENLTSPDARIVLGVTNEGTHIIEQKTANERKICMELAAADGLNVVKIPTIGFAKKKITALSDMIEMYETLTSFLV